MARNELPTDGHIFFSNAIMHVYFEVALFIFK